MEPLRLSLQVTLKSHFKKATSNGAMDNQAFWKLVKPFLSNEGDLEGREISLVKKGEIITDNQTLATIFNDHYINIVENSSGTKPCSISDEFPSLDDRASVRIILDKYKNHSSVKAITRNIDSTQSSFSFRETNNSEVLELLKSVDIKKSIGEDQIPRS